MDLFVVCHQIYKELHQLKSKEQFIVKSQALKYIQDLHLAKE